MAFLNLIGGIKSIAVIVIILTALGYVWKLKHDAAVVKTELTRVTQERDTAATARDIAIAVNKSNQILISQLKNERDLADSSLINLKRSNLEIEANTTKIKNSIKAQAVIPENNTLLSPVLKSTVQAIQTNRSKVAP